MTDNVFVKCAEKVGWRPSGQLYAAFHVGGPLSDTYQFIPNVTNREGRQLLMLAVLGKMGWGIDSNEDGWWFGSLKYDATGPFPFPALPEAVCKAFLSDKSHGIDTEKGERS